MLSLFGCNYYQLKEIFKKIMYYSFIYAGTLVINNIGTGSKIQKQSKVMMFIVVVKVIKVRWCSNFGRQIYLYLFFICSIHDPPMSGNSFLSHHSSPLVESHRLFREQCEYLFFHGDVFVYFSQHLTFRVGLMRVQFGNLWPGSISQT